MITVIISLVVISSISALIAVRYAIVHPQKEAKVLEGSKSEFIALTAHYFLTPLSIIKGTIAELLSPDSSTLGASDRTKRYETIQVSVNTLLRMVQNTSTVTAIDTGTLHITPNPTVIVDIVDDLLSEWHAEVSQKEIAIHFNRPRQTLVEQINIDTEKIRQAIGNIIANAVKFTPQKGTIEVNVQEEKNGYTIQVIDSGIGIVASEMAKLFTRFHRATSYLNLDYEGMGLGLYIAKYLIEANGGTVAIESREKAGTKVTIFFPTS